ncbi:hypothetical protein L9F63_001895 [Diploptera punctata]|uniref:Uncharacterized protein n=1 Tax=Diploptera punctata TaxID=6984 RepID=A0AAD8A3X6_DIPPU|nr:hypothetical protein L9F63_001895 [Diploptera punctata]
MNRVIDCAYIINYREEIRKYGEYPVESRHTDTSFSMHITFKMTNKISAVFLLILTHNQISGCKHHITNIEIGCKNDEYFGESTVSVTDDGANAIFSSNTVVIKDLPDDIQCSMEAYYKDETGEWKLMPDYFPKGPCCKLINEMKLSRKLEIIP